MTDPDKHIDLEPHEYRHDRYSGGVFQPGGLTKIFALIGYIFVMYWMAVWIYPIAASITDPIVRWLFGSG